MQTILNMLITPMFQVQMLLFSLCKESAGSHVTSASTYAQESGEHRSLVFSSDDLGLYIVTSDWVQEYISEYI